MMSDSVLRAREINATYPKEVEARALHDRLVAYAHFVAGDPESRSGVCCEHSYARVREGEGAGGAGVEVRELLSAAPPPSPPAPLDVEHVSWCAPPALPDLGPGTAADSDADDVDEADAWEERVTAQAPSAAFARLAHAAIDALRDLRLARLTHAGAAMRREQARAAARRLRRELAPLWAGGRAAGWLHGALCGALPRRERALYEEVVAELRRSVPRLAERLVPHAPSAPPDPLEPADAVAACGGGGEDEAGALLVWVAGGAGDARWLRRLRPLVATRELVAGPAERRLGPERWCAASAATARAQLEDLLADIGGRRAVVLGGCGAGAALAAALAGAARAQALLLLAPPLLTAEGAREDPDDILHELRMPMLVVCGSGAAACGRGAAAELCAAGGAAGGRGARRLVVLGGADGALRVPAALRRRLRLPQHAVDAAVADECARWVRELQQEWRERQERQQRQERQERAERHTPGAELAEEQAPPSPPASPAALPAGTRVVSRALGGTPLALPPPVGGRRAPAPAPAQLNAADILQLPIVFADDDPPAFAAAGLSASDVTLCAGAGGPPSAPGAPGAPGVPGGGARARLTRVIVARRARSGPARRAPRPPH